MISSLALRAVRSDTKRISEGWLVEVKIDVPTAFGGTTTSYLVALPQAEKGKPLLCMIRAW